MESVAGMVTFFIFAFTSVFAIVNPFSTMITFVSLTGAMSANERNSTAKLAVIVACIMAIVFALAGELVLRLFNISVDNLRVAGGLLLLLVSIDMLLAKTTRESVTPEEMKDATHRERLSIFPIATPMLTGPGTITTVIVVIRTADTLPLKAVTMVAILATFAIAFVVLRFSNRIYKFMGITASMVITRIMGLILAAIAVNFITVGIWNIYKSFISSGG